MTADRTMLITRTIRAPARLVWGAWMNPETLPQWWGPDGYSCRTSRIDLREGGEWVFDMIGPDGTVWPNPVSYTHLDVYKRQVLRLALSADTRRSNSKGVLDIRRPFRLGATSLGIWLAR